MLVVQESAATEALSAPEKTDSLSAELLELEKQINVIQGILKAERAQSESDQMPNTPKTLK